MILIVFDKLMQYQIVDPTDVVAWTFAHCPAVTSGRPKTTFSAFQWDLLKSALDKANGRVMVQRKKVAVLRREADDTAAIAIAHEGMEVDPEANPGMLLTPAVASICVLSTSQTSSLREIPRSSLLPSGHPMY